MTDEESNGQLPVEIQRQAGPIISRLPPNQQREVKQLIMQVSRLHSGPLPDADTLRQYNDIVPGMAERLVRMLEIEGEHRREQESTLVRSHTTLAGRGQVIGAILTVLLTASAVWLGILGHDILAGTIATTTIGAVVTVFVLGRRAEDQSPDETPDEPPKGSSQNPPKARKRKK